jgi:hypothetical protein
MPTQTLLIEDWPSKELVRMLNPNSGDSHWGAKQPAKKQVDDVVFAAVRKQDIRPVRDFAIIRPTFIVPDAIRRDDDNYATGVLKRARDCLVRLRILPGDDFDRLRQCPVVFSVERGRRALKLRISSVEDICSELSAALYMAVSSHAPYIEVAAEMTDVLDPTLATKIRERAAVLRSA